jgi:hypothetical protein
MAQTRLVTDLWSRTVDAQLDLARMAARSRQLALAIVGAALIVAAVLAGTGAHVTVALGGASIAVHVSVLVLGAAAVLIGLVRIFDLEVYERMQRGAAALAEALEKKEPELLGGMAKKVAFVSDERTRRMQTYVAAVPAVLAGLVLIAGNTGKGAVAGTHGIPAPPDTTFATTASAGETDLALEGSPTLEPSPTAAVAPTTAVAPTATTVPAQNQMPAAKQTAGKKGAPAAAGTAGAAGTPAAPGTAVAAGAKPVEDDGIAELEAAAKAASAKPEPAKTEPAKTEAVAARTEEPKADPPPAPKVEEPKADPPPAPKVEEPKPADPSPPPAQ